MAEGEQEKLIGRRGSDVDVGSIRSRYLISNSSIEPFRTREKMARAMEGERERIEKSCAWRFAANR